MIDKLDRFDFESESLEIYVIHFFFFFFLLRSILDSQFYADRKLAIFSGWYHRVSIRTNFPFLFFFFSFQK